MGLHDHRARTGHPLRAISCLLLVVLFAACQAAPQRTSAPPASTPATSSRSATAAASSHSVSRSGSAAVHPVAGEQGWIAYQTGGDNHETVRLIRPDGTEDHEIAVDAPGQHLHPDWSPDGTRLMFTSRTEADSLYVLDIASGTATPLWPCTGPCIGDDEAVWSPDGSTIAFVRATPPSADGVPSCALMLADVAGTNIRPLTAVANCQDRPTFPHWSTDGTRISYYKGVYHGDRTLSTALYVLDVASHAVRKLTDDALFAGDSDWSIGDQWIVFSSHPLNDFQCCQTSNLYRVHPDGSGLQQLTQQTSDARRLTQPRFTPDRQHLLVTGVTPAARELWILPPDGAGDPTVVHQTGIFTHGTWQPAPQ